MDDNTRAALDAEAPVNPYSLLDAVNDAARRSNGLWLIFLGLMAYTALTLASVTHRDLLLDTGIALPLLQTRIDLVRFFILAPAAFVLVHLVVIAQFVLLARKALEFDAALRLLESTDLRSHPLRLDLDSFFFVQAIAGPERSRVVSAFLHGISWATLLVLPLLLLLYMQVAFLPFHDAMVTAVQRGIVLADIVLVLLAGVFLMRSETSFLGALLRMTFSNPGSVAFGLAVLGGVGFVSVFLATVPGGSVRDGAQGVSVGPLFGVFARNLDVADANLVTDKGGPLAERTVSLRGRDLRFARLDRSDLRLADLTGANLDGASLAGADLRDARLGCAGPVASGQSEGRQKAGCTRARGSDFSAARLSGANLSGADLRGARLDDAVMDRADLSEAQMAGATFERAQLRRANLSGATSLEGASFLQANLQGAVLTGARLQMADFSGAGLQGASLAGAHLEGAALREADLEGAELQQARLYGADLRGAKLQAADLAGATVWRTVPPGGDAVALADLANILIKPPGKADVEALKAVLARAEAQPAGERTAGLGGLLGEAAGWAGSADAQAWSNMLRASEAAMADGFRTRLSEHLGRMACRARFADGAVAAGLVRRVASQGYKGAPGVVADRLKANCPGARILAPAALLDLAATAEAAQAQ